jgi:dTDP-4-dehydrorhamnose 3,5-epimerase
MKVTRFFIDGPLIIEPSVFYDNRGYFFELYNVLEYSKAGITPQFAQDNISLSHKNVLRGLHFQNPPYEQGKLVRVLSGSVTDVIVDIRKKSPTFGKNLVFKLDSKELKALWIPPGFAHGFLSMEDNTTFIYKCTKPYNKAAESGIIWNDPDLAIEWHIADPVISTKDTELGSFRQLNSLF